MNRRAFIKTGIAAALGVIGLARCRAVGGSETVEDVSYIYDDTDEATRLTEMSMRLGTAMGAALIHGPV